MINFVHKKGNIFDSSADIIVNPVNSVGIMDSEISQDFQRKYNVECENFNEYSLRTIDHLKTKDREPELIGPVLYEKSSPQILMFPIKIGKETPTTLEIIKISAQRTANILRYSNKESMAITRVGCGAGKLAWKDVKLILEKEFSLCDLSTIEFWS